MDAPSSLNAQDTDSDPTLQYLEVPLYLTLESFRLLYFWRDKSGTICGRLETFGASNAPPYMALSYTWGDPSLTHEIMLQRKRYRIRENLFNALNATLDYMKFDPKKETNPADLVTDRIGGPLKYIWIDSICIDQSNIMEKNHQVGMMKDIYAGAALVLAWLGPSDATSRSAMRLFHKYRKDGVNRSSLESLKKRFWVSRKLAWSTYVYPFLEWEYWHRMWIVQEIALARRWIAMCGSDAIDGNVITQCVSYVSQVGDHPTGLAVLKAKQSDRELGALIHTFYKHKCLDSRDRVYALLSIVEDHIAGSLSKRNKAAIGKEDMEATRSMQRIIADYNISPFELFLQLFRLPTIPPKYDTSSGPGFKWIFDDVQLALEIPKDLLIPIDKRNTELDVAQETLTQARPREDLTLDDLARLQIDMTSKNFLEYVQSMDWKDVKSWRANYEALRLYEQSCSSFAHVRMDDLVCGFGLQPDWYQWAFTTLQEN
jgi:hypothetical protein